MSSVIDYAFLETQTSRLAEAYAKAAPFHWLKLDNFLAKETWRELNDAFGQVIERVKKDPDAPKKHKHVLRKIGVVQRELMEPIHRELFEELHSPRFVRWISAVTGIDPVYVDPELNGGGLHEIYRGGYLNVHTDFNFHPNTGKHRRLNILYYLNPHWEDEWEGYLELWPEAGETAVARIAPIGNRMVLFETSEISFHGHPVPLNVPEGVTRRSIAAYYYSDWPADLDRRDKTNYRLVPWQKQQLAGEVKALVDERVEPREIIRQLSERYQPADVERALNVAVA